MSRRDELITVITTFKTVSPTITDEQRIGLLRQAVQNYELSIEEASEVLSTLGLIVGEEVNYFEVLGFSIEEIQNLDEDTIVNLVETAHKKSYSASLRAGARVRPDGRTEEQWRHILNQARDTLKDPQKREEYLTTLSSQKDLHENASLDPEPIPPNIPETDSASILSVNTLQHSEPMAPATPEIISAPTLSNVNVPTDMVIIPAGEFLMGSNDEDANDSEKPVHPAYVDAFFMDKYLVTNAQYKAFLDASPQWQKDNILTDYHNGNYLRTWNGNN